VKYDVSADGQRFLMVKSESGVAHLSIVLQNIASWNQIASWLRQLDLIRTAA
jgi:Tol biopolymer transport system component